MNWEQKNLRCHYADLTNPTDPNDLLARLVVYMPRDQGNWGIRVIRYDKGAQATMCDVVCRDDGTYFTRLADAKAAAEAAVAES